MFPLPKPLPETLAPDLPRPCVPGSHHSSPKQICPLTILCALNKWLSALAARENHLGRFKTSLRLGHTADELNQNFCRHSSSISTLSTSSGNSSFHNVQPHLPEVHSKCLPQPGGQVSHLLLPSDGLHVFFHKLPLETMPSRAHDIEGENARHTLGRGNLGHYPSNMATYRCLLGGSALVTPPLHKPWQQERRENKYTQPIRSAYPNLEARETHEFQSH